MRNLVLIATILLVSVRAWPESLFDSDATLSIHLEAPFSQIRRERDKATQYPAKLMVVDGSELPVELQVRGNNRLKKTTCKYPPLRVYFDKDSVKGTIFRKQSNLKLVVACKNQFEDYVRLEYLIYKAFSLLSDNSFKVRYLEITYIDDGKERVSPGFFIEQKKAMGKRLGLTQVHENNTSLSALDLQAALLVDMFQLMIGNTDYSNLTAPGDEDCCHNTKLMMATMSGGNGFIPVPYDFDSAGLINAKYAVPPDGLSLSSVKTRKYRGFCRANEHLPQMIVRFKKQAETVISLFRDDPMLSKRSIKSAVRYLEGYFEILDGEKKRTRYLTDGCRT